MPQLVIEPGGLDLGDHNLVSLLQQVDPLRRYFAEDAHGQAGTGERLAGENLLGHAEVAANAANLIFEKIAQRLNELEFHALGQSAHVVMALDGLARALHA